MNYFDIVFSVLQKWYKALAHATPKIVVGILVFVLILMMSSYLSRLFVRLFHRLFPKSKNNSIVILINVFKFLIILAAAFISFEIMGLGDFVLKFLGSLGVAGVIAGVALKDLVSSMFSGALIGIDKAFAEGDYVSIKDITGVVESIGFLTTKIISDDGKKVYVPNQLIFSAPFINYSASGQRKVFLKLQLSNDQDLDKSRSVIMQEIKTFEFTEEPDGAEVVVSKQVFGIFFLEARFFMRHGADIDIVRSEALIRIKKKLQANGIELATQAQLDACQSGL